MKLIEFSTDIINRAMDENNFSSYSIIEFSKNIESDLKNQKVLFIPLFNEKAQKEFILIFDKSESNTIINKKVYFALYETLSALHSCYSQGQFVLHSRYFTREEYNSGIEA